MTLIRPSKWLMEAVSASDTLLLAAMDSYGDGSGAGSSGACVHFDGGAHAIFERIPSSVSDLFSSIYSYSSLLCIKQYQ